MQGKHKIQKEHRKPIEFSSLHEIIFSLEVEVCQSKALEYVYPHLRWITMKLNLLTHIFLSLLPLKTCYYKT